MIVLNPGHYRVSCFLIWYNFYLSIRKAITSILMCIMKSRISVQPSKVYNRWSLGMEKLFYHTFYWACYCLSMLRLKLIHVSIRGSCWPSVWVVEMEYFHKTAIILIYRNHARPIITGISSSLTRSWLELWTLILVSSQLIDFRYRVDIFNQVSYTVPRCFRSQNNETRQHHQRTILTLIQSVILFSNVVHRKCHILIWNWSR